MVKACLKAGTYYLDITGEVPVFEKNFEYDAQAREAGISLISGVGFDVVPTDCLANYVSDQIENPTHLEIAVAGESGFSAGTLKTVMEHINEGILIRKDGKLIKLNGNKHIKEVKFTDKTRTVVPTTWGDLATAYRKTNIPNITVYMPYSKKTTDLIKTANSDKKKMMNWIEKNVKGPDLKTRQTARSYIWVKAFNNDGEEAEAWLETMEGYRFTAIAGVRAVEKVFELKPTGALTPALAFGDDFVLELPETQRYDKLIE
jgi:short subunit dehydrogenase-like uncharacterized protein